MIRKMSVLQRLMLLKMASGRGSLTEYEATGNPAAFNTNVAKPLKQLLIAFSPVQAEGTPSPENLLPITGWTGVDVTANGTTIPVTFPALGKNLFNKDATPFKTGYYLNYSDSTGGEPSFTSHVNYNVYRVPVKPSTSYMLDSIKANDPSVCCVDADGYVTKISKNSGGSSGTNKNFTTTEDAVALLVSVAVSGSFKCDDVLQIEEGSSATAYEPYTNTAYGGTLDLTTGVLTVEWEKVVAVGASSESWNISTTYDEINRFTISPATLGGNLAKNGTSNYFFSYCKHSSARDEWNGWFGSTGNILLYTPKSIDSRESFLSYLSEHNLEICYELDEPFTIQLDPVTIQTLIGDNVIYTSTNGQNTVKYLKRG